MSEMRELIKDNLSRTLERTEFSFGQRVAGKVRDSYVVGDQRILVVSDRISAFDHILGTVPFKGQILNQTAAHWFALSADIAPNHVVAVVDPSVTVAKQCTPLKAEFVMRGYLTGTTSTSIWQSYERGDRVFCGHSLPNGLTKNQRLDNAILTPTTKGDAGAHDQNMSKEEIISGGWVERSLFERAEEIAHRLFAFGQSEARKRGLILVDTKYEMGVLDGEVVVIDEIHTPDSSRYWWADDYDDRWSNGQEPRSIDKEYVRKWMVAEHGYRGDGPPPPLSDEVRIEASLRYMENYKLITGKDFVPNTEEPTRRINDNVQAFLEG